MRIGRIDASRLGKWKIGEPSEDEVCRLGRRRSARDCRRGAPGQRLFRFYRWGSFDAVCFPATVTAADAGLGLTGTSTEIFTRGSAAMTLALALFARRRTRREKD